jgi:hypothetical protein
LVETTTNPPDDDDFVTHVEPFNPRRRIPLHDRHRYRRAVVGPSGHLQDREHSTDFNVRTSGALEQRPRTTARLHDTALPLSSYGPDAWRRAGGEEAGEVLGENSNEGV